MSIKEKKTTLGLIDHMKGKGVTFLDCREDEAEQYLKTKNDYFRVAAFRKLFPKYEGGENDGQFLALDFKHLIQLSYVDQSLRALLRSMSLNVEHYEKVAILDRISNDPLENGYSIVSDYKSGLNGDRLEHLNGEIESRSNDIYCGAIIEKYRDEMPVWAFFEIISFGTFIDFCRFCSDRWNETQLKDTHYALKKIKSIRNAAAHGACIINGFAENDGGANKTPNLVRIALGKTRLSKNKRKRWLNNPRMRDIVTLFYLHSELVGEGSSKNRARSDLTNFFAEAEVRLSGIPATNQAIAGIDFMKSLTKELSLR